MFEGLPEEVIIELRSDEGSRCSLGHCKEKKAMDMRCGTIFFFTIITII